MNSQGTRWLGSGGTRMALGVAMLLVLTQGRTEPINDGQAIATVAASIVMDGTLEYYPGYNPGYSVKGPDGKAYAKFGLAMSLLLVPAEWCTRVLSFGGDDPQLTQLLVSFIWHLIPSLLGALTFFCLLWLGRELGLSPRACVVGALVGVFCTPAWVYFRHFYSEGLLTLCLTAGIAATLAWRNTPRRRFAVTAGFATGMAFLTKPTGALIVVACGLLILLKKPRRQSLLASMEMAVGALGPLLLAFWYNRLRTGSPLGSTYTDGVDALGFSNPVWKGLWGLSVSPGKGLLWFAPVALIGALMWWRHGDAAVKRAVLGLFFVFTLIGATWWAWHGAECWGPRLLVPVLPLLALMVGQYYAEPGRAPRMVRLSVGVGLAVQCLGATIGWNEYYARADYTPWSAALQQLGADAVVDPDNMDSLLFSLSENPIVGHFSLLASDVSLLNWWPLMAEGVAANILAGVLVLLLSVGALYEMFGAWNQLNDMESEARP